MNVFILILSYINQILITMIIVIDLINQLFICNMLINYECIVFMIIEII